MPRRASVITVDASLLLSVYVAAIVWLGLYLASTIYIAYFMRRLGRYSWLKTGAVAIGVATGNRRAATLTEAGAKFEVRPLNFRKGQHMSPEYLKINPKHKVPLLVVDGKRGLGQTIARKAMAIADLGERMAFLNRGQAWVVRKLQAMLPNLNDAGLRAELQAMLDAHVGNIERVEQRLAH